MVVLANRHHVVRVPVYAFVLRANLQQGQDKGGEGRGTITLNLKL